MKMIIRLNLRSRIIIAFLLLTLVISSAFAYWVRYTMLLAEEELFNKLLFAEVSDFIEFYKYDNSIINRPRSSFTLYVQQNETGGYIPTYVLGLPVGLHEIFVDNNEYHIIVREIDEKILYFVFDLTDFEEHEEFINTVLIIGILIAVFASVWIGYLTGNRVISPVRRLAKQVNRLHEDPTIKITTDDYTSDEVGLLAREFEIYIQRLQAFLDRERNFTADVSHELRTPLTIINGAAEVLLANPDLNQKERQKLESIFRAGTDMAQTISAFLLLAREPGKNPDKNLEDTLLSRVVQQQMNQFQHLLRDKPIEVHLNIKEDIHISAEPQMASIVVGNLLKNAYTHTEKGTVDITLNNNELWIKDTGPGIDPDFRDRIFERAFQINKNKAKGTGIGLSIAKRLADRYNWDISIHGRPGGGTKVILKFNPNTHSC